MFAELHAYAPHLARVETVHAGVGGVVHDVLDGIHAWLAGARVDRFALLVGYIHGGVSDT